MQRIISAFIIFLISILNLFADGSDYGKYYSIREGYTGTPLWFVIVVIAGIWLLYKLISKVISRFDKKRRSTDNIATETLDYQSEKEQTQICPNCNGIGFIKAGPVYSDYEMCKYCHGYGKEFSNAALKYYENLNIEYVQRREQRQVEDRHIRGISAFIYNHIPSNYSLLLENELKKCNPCPHCNGNGILKLDTFFEMDERLNMVKYKRLLCPQCNGRGTILIK